YYYFFFFQAEDGIRDFHVTGVQTCALPISMKAGKEMTFNAFVRATDGQKHDVAWTVDGDAGTTLSGGTSIDTNGKLTVGASQTRSEERRVGKESRARWEAEDAQEKASASKI